MNYGVKCVLGWERVDLSLERSNSRKQKMNYGEK